MAGIRWFVALAAAGWEQSVTLAVVAVAVAGLVPRLAEVALGIRRFAALEAAGWERSATSAAAAAAVTGLVPRLVEVALGIRRFAALAVARRERSATLDAVAAAKGIRQYVVCVVVGWERSAVARRG